MLVSKTPDEWINAVLLSFNEFLNDHAANERKASAAAMSLVAHYPDKPLIITAMVDLALEELGHYKQVIKLMLEFDITPSPDEKDRYVNRLIKNIRKDTDDYFLDRLLSAAVIEARGAERFGLIAVHHADDRMKRFYRALEKSESGHYKLFLELASNFFPQNVVELRWQEWLEIESRIMLDLPIRARLH